MFVTFSLRSFDNCKLPYGFIFFSQAVTYEQHGFLEQAQAAYELAMTKARADIAVRPAPVKLHSEMKLWEERWIR